MKAERKSKIAQKSGLPPGSLIHIGEKMGTSAPNLLIEYDGGSFLEKKLTEEILEKDKNHKKLRWYKIVGLSDIELIKDLQSKFNIHSLIMEDVLNTQIRPKYEAFHEGLFLSIKHLFISNNNQQTISETISFILLDKVIITFQERDSNLYSAMIKRLIDGISSANNRSFDYLFYRLIDIVIDEYFVVLEDMNERIEKLEERVINKLAEDQKNEIQLIRSEIINRRKEINPIKEAVFKLVNDPPELIKENTLKYFIDIQEHITQIKETIDYQRESVSSVMELYQVGMGNRMNQVMQTLTFIATIFIPLSFVAGLYGMNFKFMPELEWDYGYFMVLGLMATMVIGMMYYFKRKKWF